MLMLLVRLGLRTGEVRTLSLGVTPQRCALFEAGVDTMIIALWLGHERVDTTAIYLQAHLAIKERALAKIRTPQTLGRDRPRDALLTFLEAL